MPVAAASGDADNVYVVYQRASVPVARDHEEVADWRTDVWRPSATSPVPRGFPRRFSAWTVANGIGVFKNHGLAVYFIEESGQVIHRSALLPAWFRWPFMKDDDLQVSSVWTDPDFRGEGIATQVLRAICRDAGTTHDLWYTSRSENEASLRVAEKAGFSRAHTARRRKRLGSRVLGSLELVD